MLTKTVLKRVFPLILLLTVSFSSFAGDPYALTKEEKAMMLEEAEDCIDEMPEGLQDRISDAILHAMKGFGAEIEYFRSYPENSIAPDNKVTVKCITDPEGGKTSCLLYQSQTVDSKTKLPLLIYFHGGGWSVGSLNAVDRFCRLTAAEGKIRVVSIDYPLAPENNYQQILASCVGAIKKIKKTISGIAGVSSISLGGDGAGANLAYNSCLALKDSSDFDGEIKSLVLFYPLTGDIVSKDDPLKRKYGKGYGLDSRLLETFYMAIDGIAVKGEIGTLPPTLLIMAGRDIIIGAEEQFSSRLNPGNHNRSIVFDGSIHGFITDGKQNTALQKASEMTNLFVGK